MAGFLLGGLYGVSGAPVLCVESCNYQGLLPARESQGSLHLHTPPYASCRHGLCTHTQKHTDIQSLTTFGQIYFGGIFAFLIYTYNMFMSVFAFPLSSSMRRLQQSFHASGIWSKPIIGTKKSSRRLSVICLPKEPQITSLASHLPLNSFSM